MQKLKILIEENAFGAVRSVEVSAAAPISALVPALVEELKLPQTDLFGKQLVYVLREVVERRILSEDSTLLACGVKSGTRLALDSYVIDGSVAAIMGNPQEWGTGGEEQMQEVEYPLGTGRPPGSPLLYTDSPMAEYSRGGPGGRPVPSSRSATNGLAAPERSADVDLDPAFHAAATLADHNGIPVLDLRNTSAPLPAVKKRSWTRRAFLALGSTALVVGGASLGYAAYHTWINGGLKIPNSTGTHPLSTVPRIPPKPLIPTMVRPIFTFRLHRQIVRTVAWSPDGTMLASGADDTQLFVWSTSGIVRQRIQHPAAVHAVAWSPDGQQLVTGAANQITFFNSLTGATLAHSTNQHIGMVTSLAWTPHNQMQVVSGAADMRAIVWNPTNHEPETIFKRHTAPIEAVTWAVDGQTVASSSQGGFVRVWNAANSQELHAPYINTQVSMRAIAFAPSGTLLAVGGDDGSVRLWNGLTCQQQVMGNPIDHCIDVPMRLQASKQAIRTVAWSPDARFLAIGGNDGTFSIWYPTQSQKPLLSVRQNAAVHSIVWMPGGTHIATASENTVMIWELT